MANYIAFMSLIGYIHLWNVCSNLLLFYNFIYLLITLLASTVFFIYSGYKFIATYTFWEYFLQIFALPFYIFNDRFKEQSLWGLFYLFLHFDKNQYIGCLGVTIDVMRQHEEKQLMEGKGSFHSQFHTTTRHEK